MIFRVRHQPNQVGRMVRRIGHEREVQQPCEAHELEISGIPIERGRIQQRKLRGRYGRKRIGSWQIVDNAPLDSRYVQQEVNPVPESPDQQYDDEDQPHPGSKRLFEFAAILLSQTLVLGFGDFLPAILAPERSHRLGAVLLR